MNDKTSTKPNSLPGKRILWVAYIAIFIAFTSYWGNFSSGWLQFSDNMNDWGTFGDYIGGFLNPILSFLALIMVLLTLRSNQEALKQNEQMLKLSHKELKATQDQISQNNAALKEQIQAIQKNAKLERLANHADRVSKELDSYKLDTTDRESRLRNLVPLLNVGAGSQPKINVWEAFDTKSNIYGMTKTREQLGDAFETLSQHTLGDFIRLIKALNRLCGNAVIIDSSAAAEFSEYYRDRYGSVCKGLCDKNYVGLMDLTAIKDK